MGMLDIGVNHRLAPLIEIDEIEGITIVRNSPGPELQKVRYYCPLKILAKYGVIRVLSKLIIMIYLILKEKPDVVISYYMKASGIIALFSSKICNVPVNFNVISGPEEFKLFRIGGKDYRVRLFENFFLCMTKHFDSVTTTGTKTKEYLVQNGIKRELIDILPDSVDLDVFKPIPEKKKYHIITVARFDPAKRLDNFLKIISKVKSVKSNIKVGIVGDGPLRADLERLAEELDLLNTVEFLGFQNNVQNYYNSSRIFILTSEREGLPMVVLEAMGCGLPCVVSNVGNILDLAVDGFNSIVIQNYDDIDAFVEGVLRLLEDEEVYYMISRNSQKTVRENYSYENVKDVWKTISRKIGKNGNTQFPLIAK